MMWWWLLPAFVALLLFCPVYLYAYYDGEFRIDVYKRQAVSSAPSNTSPS